MKKPTNRNAVKIKILLITLVLIFALMGGFTVALIRDMYTMNKGQSFYDSVAATYYSPQNQTAQKVEETTTIITPPTDAPPPVFEAALDFNALREFFPDITGWLKAENTVINYPIVQGVNNEYYLDRLPDGTQNKMGSIFLDFRNSADFSDDNIFIYGHHMRSGDKFGTFRQYKQQDYFENHSTMSLYTSTDNFTIDLFAAYILDSANEIPPMRFINQTDFELYMNHVKERSFFSSDTQVSFGDKLIFLCTCNDSGNKNERLILVGKIKSTQ